MKPVIAVDFDEKYIISGSADGTIKVHVVHMCGGGDRGREEGTELGGGGEREESDERERSLCYVRNASVCCIPFSCVLRGSRRELY